MEQDQALEKVLERMTDLVNRSDRSLGKIEEDIAELKDARYKPYFTTMGAFLVITLGVMSYVYNLETRYNSNLLKLHSDMSAIMQSVTNLSDRLASRTNNMQMRWIDHREVHRQTDVSWRLLVNRLLDTGALTADFGLIKPEDEKGKP